MKYYNPEGKHHIVLIDEIEPNKGKNAKKQNNISLLSDLKEFQFIFLLKPPQSKQS